MTADSTGADLLTLVRSDAASQAKGVGVIDGQVVDTYDPEQVTLFDFETVAVRGPSPDFSNPGSEMGVVSGTGAAGAHAKRGRRQRRISGRAAAGARCGRGFGYAGCSEGGGALQVEIGQVVLGLVRAG